MMHVQLSAFVAVTLLQLCHTEISNTEWYSANVINDSNPSPKPLTEMFTDDSLSIKNPTTVLVTSGLPTGANLASTIPTFPQLFGSNPWSFNETVIPLRNKFLNQIVQVAQPIPQQPLQTQTQPQTDQSFQSQPQTVQPLQSQQQLVQPQSQPQPVQPQSQPQPIQPLQSQPQPTSPTIKPIQLQPVQILQPVQTTARPQSLSPIVQTIPPTTSAPITQTQSTTPIVQAIQQQPVQPIVPPIPTQIQPQRIQLPLSLDSPSPTTSQPNYVLIYQQAPQSIQTYPSNPSQAPTSVVQPVQTLIPRNTPAIPCNTPVSTKPLISNQVPTAQATRVPSVRVRVVSPRGTITNVNINSNNAAPSTTLRPSTTKTRRNRRRNNYDGCVNGCTGGRDPICATPLGVTPVNPDTLRGFPSVCHMACHNSFRKTPYEKVLDGRCGRFRTRIRPTGSKNKLKKDDLNKAQYTVVETDGPKTIVEFTPLVSL